MIALLLFKQHSIPFLEHGLEWKILQINIKVWFHNFPSQMMIIMKLVLKDGKYLNNIHFQILLIDKLDVLFKLNHIMLIWSHVKLFSGT